MRRRHMLTVVVLTSHAACASVNTNGPASDAERAGRSSDVITSRELRNSGVPDALQAINRLRPLFLRRGREMSALSPNKSLLQVYLDDVKLGGLETLQTIPIEAIKSITYLSSSEATIRWGTNHTGGVILLGTK